MAFFKKEPCWIRVERLLRQAEKGKARLFLCLINWGEIYYQILRYFDASKAEEVAGLIDLLPIKITNVDRELVKLAAIQKAAGKFSYADCFVFATAKILKGKIITGDPEFKKLKDEIEILWLENK